MVSIGLSVGHSDILIVLYVIAVIGVVILAVRHWLLINAMGFADVFVATAVVALTFTFVRAYALTEVKYVQIWRLILKELLYIRKTYGVMEIRLVFHFLVKRVQLKSFYGDDIDLQMGLDILRLVDLWSKLVYRDLATFNLDATYRVRIICLERAIKQGLKNLRG